MKYLWHSFLSSAMLFSVLVSAQEPGTPIFSDDFNSNGLYAERWTPKGGVVLKENKPCFPGRLMMKQSTPLEFCAEAEIVILPNTPEKKRNGWGGFMLNGPGGEMRFQMNRDAKTTFCVWKLTGDKNLKGKYVIISGGGLGNPIRITLFRLINGTNALYLFKVNGKEIMRIAADLPKMEKDSSGNERCDTPLFFDAYRCRMVLNHFSLSTVKRSVQESPNMVINSSFEHAVDSLPLYFCRALNGFDYSKSKEIPYEKYIETWGIDSSEKHSGNYSLKMVLDERINTYPDKGQFVCAHGPATLKGAPGVFSVWLKADRENFPVKLLYGTSRNIKVGKEWKRYEVVNPSLPSVGTVSHVQILFREKGTLWVDDLQAELIPRFDKEKWKSGGTFATAYKASEQDKRAFAKPKETVRPADFNIPELPAGIHPSPKLDDWKKHAVKLDKFYSKGTLAINKTNVYLACDTKNLYLSYQCFVPDLKKIDRTKTNRDAWIFYDSAEWFIDPEGDMLPYHFAVNPSGSQTDYGRKSTRDWNGNWSVNVKLNEKDNSVDYFIRIPFSDFAAPTLKNRWLMNICRNDGPSKENASIGNRPKPNFSDMSYWAYANLPEKVIARWRFGVSGGNISCMNSGNTATLQLVNLTGLTKKIKIDCFSLKDQTTPLGTKNISVPPGTHDVSFRFDVPREIVRTVITENGNAVSIRNIKLENRSPAFLLSRYNYYMNEPEAIFRVLVNVAGHEKMKAKLSLGKTAVTASVTPEFLMKLPLSGIPDGKHSVIFSLLRDGKVFYTAKVPLVKRAFRKDAVQINQFSRSLVIDGKSCIVPAPFFPGSRFHTEAYVKGFLDFVERYGFKYVHFLAPSGNSSNTDFFMKYAEEKGIKVILWILHEYYPTRFQANAPEKKEPYFPYKDISEKIRHFNSYSNIIARMVLDETELDDPSEAARKYMAMARSINPYNPVYMNNTHLGIPMRYANLEMDILSLDFYITNAALINLPVHPVAKMLSHADEACSAGLEKAKPAFYILVSNNFPLHYREPSYAEQISQTYGAFLAGCSGITWYAGMPASRGNWAAILQLNKELLALNEVLLSEEKCESSVSSAGPKQIRHLTKKLNGSVYLVTCSTDAKPIGKTTFRIPSECAGDGEAEVLFENRTVPVKNGVVTDSFDAFARHVYKIKIH